MVRLASRVSLMTRILKFHFLLFRVPTFLLTALCDVIVRFAYLYQGYRFHILL